MPAPILGAGGYDEYPPSRPGVLFLCPSGVQEIRLVNQELKADQTVRINIRAGKTTQQVIDIR